MVSSGGSNVMKKLKQLCLPLAVKFCTHGLNLPNGCCSDAEISGLTLLSWVSYGVATMILWFLSIIDWDLVVRKWCIVHSFVHSGYFYSASSSPLLLKGSPDYSIDTGLE